MFSRSIFKTKFSNPTIHKFSSLQAPTETISHTVHTLAPMSNTAGEIPDKETTLLVGKLIKIFEEVRTSHASHVRKLKELFHLFNSSSSQQVFFAAFSRALIPLFQFGLRTASADRIVKFVAAFATFRSEKSSNALDTDEFLERFLRFLLPAAIAANKDARLRACQIVSEIIMRLPDDTEVSDELWDEVIECMKSRVNDKIPAVRTFAIRALSRVLNDLENSDILQLFLDKLTLEQNSDVRKTIVLSLPASNATLTAITECTLDVSESVRKAVYCVIASKFPLQTLSIKLRTVLLQRGLSDRATTVVKDCFKLMKDEWLAKVCNGDPVELLKYLDVETYEAIGESVMSTILKAGLATIEEGQGLRNFVASISETDKGHCERDIVLMEPEVALYWKSVCKYLHMVAQAKGSDAATTTGTESAMYAEEATYRNDLLDSILPAAVSDYVALVNAHIVAGPNYRFATRQLLLLGAILDFSDATHRKVAGKFVQDLLHRPFDHEVDENGNEVVIGDGINLGGDRDWAAAVAQLARKVHASPGEFEDVVLEVIVELAQPCRERIAAYNQWLHCLAVTGLLLENLQSFFLIQGKAIEPAELLVSLLLPGVKHAHSDVQRAAVRCLGLFGLLERKPSEELVNQLRCSFVMGPYPVKFVACKALMDLAMWHGPHELDKSITKDLISKLREQKIDVHLINFCDENEVLDMELLDLLYAGIEMDSNAESTEGLENERITSVTGEGFAKILLLGEKHPNADTSLHPILLSKLISMYFSTENSQLERLKQCLSVFFEHYPCLSVNHKKCLSKAFIPVMRCLWPGVNPNAKGSPATVASMRKRAVHASHFMLQMMQTQLYEDKTVPASENQSDGSTDVFSAFESGDEGLGIRIAAEIAGFHFNKTAAEKAYISALCRLLGLLHFRSSEQGPVKLMQLLLNHIAECVATDKEIVKELRRTGEQLKAVDRNPDQNLSPDEANLILGRLDLELKFEEIQSAKMPPTPASRSVRTRGRRRTMPAEESSDEELSPTSVVPAIASSTRGRTERASKTAAMTKMTANQVVQIDELDDEDEEDQEEAGSELTSEDDSDAF